MTGIVLKALAAGLPLACVSAALGSVIQWRRMAFFGDTLAHTALLGIGLSLLLGINLLAGMAAVLALFCLYLNSFEKSRIPADTALAAIAHMSLAGGVLLLYLSGSRINWETILFGSILSLSATDVWLIVGASVAGGLVFWKIWPALIAIAVNDEIATVEMRNKRLVNLAFLLLISVYIAVGVRVVGVLLVNAMLIIPAAAARPVARSPLAMVGCAALIGMFSIGAGIGITFSWDIPAGPACVLTAGALYMASICWSAWRRRGAQT